MPVSTTIKWSVLKTQLTRYAKLTHSCKKILRHRQHKSPSQQLALAKRSIHKCHCQAWHTTGLATVAKYFPFTVSKAVKGVRMRFDTRRNAVGVILIEQKDPAAAIFETAGRANANKLSNNLEPVSAGRTRLIGPAVYKARRKIEREMQSMILDTIREVQKKI
jgi:hypothetical protein